MDEAVAAKLRALPQVQRLLESPAARALVGRSSRAAVAGAVRAVLDEARAALVRQGGTADAPDLDELLARTGAALALARQPIMRRVVNATGIVLHTNLGRAPLAPEAAAAVADAARGYTNLEYDLEAGTRGPRAAGVEAALRAVTGAEAALAVNNCAAAVLLAVAALAGGGEVVVSRGELVEIGGGFRIPEVIQQGCARLVEVGTTNKTRAADYRDAITPDTRVLLKVHPSNYRITGFTAAAGLHELSALARERGLLLLHDLGSGALGGAGGPAEATVQDSLAAGTDLVMFSGDKLLGGPQAGLLAGRRGAVEPLRRHPLLRAVRLDKLTLAALEATLRLHLNGAPVPALWMLGQDEAVLQARAERLAALLPPLAGAMVMASRAKAGGGTMPAQEFPSRAVTLCIPGIAVDDLARRLRSHRPAVVGRIADGQVWLDMIAVADDELPEVVAAVQAACGA